MVTSFLNSAKMDVRWIWFCVTVLTATLLQTSIAQDYNQPNQPPYNNDYNSQYNSRNSPPYNQNGSNGSRYDPYNRPYDQNNRQYDPNDRRYDPNNPNSRPYDPNNPNSRHDDPNAPNYRPYDNNNRQYDPNDRRYDPNDPNNRQYDRNNPNSRPYDPYNRQNDPNNRSYDNNNYNNRQYNQNNSNNRQYDPNQDPNNPNRDPNNPNRDFNNPNNRQYDPNNSNSRPYDSNNPSYNSNYPGNRYDSNSQFNNRFGNQPNSQFNNPQYKFQYVPQTNSLGKDKQYCLSDDEYPHLTFGSKTAYSFVYGKRANQSYVPDCTPVYFWTLNRHGANVPSVDKIRRLRLLNNIQQQIIRNYEERRTTGLCDKDIDLFRRWRWNETYNERNANTLTSQGVEDTRFLASRYLTRFSRLLSERFNDRYYNFQYDMKLPRTHDSYQAYIEGFFGPGSFNIHGNLHSDERTRPYSNCRAWTEQVEENDQSYAELRRFKEKQEYQEMVRQVFQRLGFAYSMNESIVSDMYDLCRFEKAWNIRDISTWCSAFTKEHLKILEYAADLADYYYSGPGNIASNNLGCNLVKDMYDKFEKAVNGVPDESRVSAYFTHSTALQTFLTSSGILNDVEPLTADNYFGQNNRKWKTSSIDPFSGNFVAVLYQCQRTSNYKVLFMLNESPIGFPECSVGLCDWNRVQDHIRGVAENCNMEYCEYGRAAAEPLKISHFIYIILLIPYLYFS